MPVHADAAIVEKLVVANRILARYGIVDGFGHVSVRMSAPEDGFLLSRSLAPATVKAGDILRFDLDGNAQDGDSRTPYLERFIHGEIYRARPDVQSIVHNHSPSVIPFGATRKPLRPIYHMSGFIGAASAFSKSVTRAAIPTCWCATGRWVLRWRSHWVRNRSC